MLPAIREMKPVIIPIIMPNVNWDLLLRETQSYTGDSLTSSTDLQGIKPKQDQSIVAVLSQFRRGGGLDPYKEIREATFTLKHLSFSFLCLYDPVTIVEISTSTELTAIVHHQHNGLWILGGTLLQWKQAMLEICQSTKTFSSRLFMNCVLVIFQTNGYSLIWEDYIQIGQADQTFTLEHKT